jgi:putative ABC transport system ATP-binding protein
MLEFRDFGKRFGQEVLWQSVSFSLPKRGLVVITGASGTGKTTFFRCIQQLTRYQGSLRFQGMPLEALNPYQRVAFRQQYLGCVEQGGGLMQDLKVRDQVRLIQQIKGNMMSPIVHQALQQLYQEIAPSQAIATLSKGQQQRLAIILACFGKPKILLLDEPTSGLDLANRKKVYRLIRLLSDHVLILISTHVDALTEFHTTRAITFPLKMNEVLPSLIVKSRFPPTTARQRLSSTWLIPFHFFHRRKAKFRWRFTFFQSLALGLLAVSIALGFMLQAEVLTLSQTMLGGRYQHITPKQQIALSIESSTVADMSTFSSLPSVRISHVYDPLYFEALKPFHQFYFEFEGIRSSLSGFHLGLINEGVYLPWSHPDAALPTLEAEEDVILGVQPYHLRQLSYILKCFPTVAEINEALQDQPLPLYVSMHVPSWGYQDESYFLLKAIIATDHPTWFIHQVDAATRLYETKLRLPTKGFEEREGLPPWYVSKTLLLWTQDPLRLLDDWRTDLRFQHYQLTRHHRWAWQVYRSEQPRQRLPEFINLEMPFHYHSELGYHYYPDHRISGFAQPMFLSYQQDALPYLSTLQTLKEPFQWLQVPPPKLIAIGHVLADPQRSVKLSPHPNWSQLPMDHIVVSTHLANLWQVQAGDVITLHLPKYHADLVWGMLPTLIPKAMTIHHLVDAVEPRIYQSPHWWENLLMLEGYTPSSMLQPQAWISFEDVTISNDFILREPFLEVKNQVLIMHRWLALAIGILIVFLMLPSLGLGWYYLAHHVLQDHPRIHLLLSYGASPSMIYQWYAVRLGWLMLDLGLPSCGMFITLDYLIKQQIYQQFYLTNIPSFPFVPLGIFIMIVMVIYGVFLLLIQYPIHQGLIATS